MLIHVVADYGHALSFLGDRLGRAQAAELSGGPAAGARIGLG
jgi:hypothetical protein